MNQEKKPHELTCLHQDLVDLIERYQDLPPYEVGHQIICTVVDMLLTVAPNQLLAIKTILASVQTGISRHQELNAE
jgi:hypothetical protein